VSRAGEGRKTRGRREARARLLNRRKALYWLNAGSKRSFDAFDEKQQE
jgi:hypothetical protein